MSDTPRTDEAEYRQTDSEPAEPLGMVDVSFARQLERELNAANEKVKRLEAVQAAGIALMNAVAPFSLNPDEEGDDETTIRQCQPHAVIVWEEWPTAREHVKLHEATIAFGRAVFEAKEATR